MASSLHLPEWWVSVRDGVGLVDRECVHVRAQQDAAVFLSSSILLETDDTRLSHAGLDGQSQPAEPLRNQGRGTSLLESELGMLMNVTPGGDQRCAIDRGEPPAPAPEPLHTVELGHKRFNTHSAQRGRRAIHTTRPC